MLSEFSVAGIYLPPILLYLLAAVPIFIGLRAILVRAGVLRFAWHPALFEFAVLLTTIATIVLFV